MRWNVVDKFRFSAFRIVVRRIVKLVPEVVDFHFLLINAKFPEGCGTSLPIVGTVEESNDIIPVGHLSAPYLGFHIIDIKRQSRKGVKGIKFKVTDSNLIAKTGGIVQGMSGSPIVQDGKIIGAVSHVTVENPIYGYAMHIEWMVDEANRLNRQ